MEEQGIHIYHNPKMVEAEDKDAVLVMSFGTTFSEAREKSIDAIFADVQKAFPDKKVMLSFSSKTIIRRIKEKTGQVFLSPEEALAELRSDGYNRVLLLTLDLIPGHEYDSKQDFFDMEKENFKALALSTPLMYWTGKGGTHDDVTELFEAFREGVPPHDDDMALLLMGHGSSHWANDYFLILQDKIEALGAGNYFVYTVEGNPEIEDIIPKLRRKGYHKTLLMPFLMVAGDHALNDMYSDRNDSHRAILENAGFEVSAWLHGIGEFESVRQLVVKRAELAWRRLTE